MTGFEPGSSDMGSARAVNCSTTTAHRQMDLFGPIGKLENVFEQIFYHCMQGIQTCLTAFVASSSYLSRRGESEKLN